MGKRPFGPLKGASKFTKLGTFDLETWGFRADGDDAFALGVVNLGDGRRYRFTERDAMVAFLTSRECRGYTMFAHNLSGFDGLCLFGDPSEFFGTENVLLKGGKWIVARWKDGKNVVRFCDSLNIFQTSIEKIGEALHFPKGDTPQKFILGTHEPITEEDFRYCEQDTEVLLRALELLRDELGEVRPTAPSLAIHYFQRNFVDREWWIDDEADQRFKEAYYGARTEVYFKGDLPEGDNFTYDINSLYPESMQNGDFPDPSALTEELSPTHGRFTNILRDFEGCAKLSVECSGTEIGYLPVRREDRRIIFPLGKFEGTWCFPEIRYALATGTVKIKDISWCVFGPRISSPFKGFVDTVYPLKVKYAGDFRRELYKLLQNSLYGKFCEHHIENEWYCSRFDEALYLKLKEKYGDIRWERMDDLSEKGYFKTGPNSTHEARTAHTIFSWGAYITSISRVSNARWQDKIRAAGAHVYYTDTDSFVVDRPLPDDWVSPTILGALKLEKYSRMERIDGNKDYTREGGPRQVKGVARGKANGCQIVGYSPTTHRPNAYQFTRLVRVREARRRGLKYGSRLLITKILKDNYDKRVVLENGGTEPCRLV